VNVLLVVAFDLVVGINFFLLSFGSSWCPFLRSITPYWWRWLVGRSMTAKRQGEMTTTSLGTRRRRRRKIGTVAIISSLKRRSSARECSIPCSLLRFVVVGSMNEATNWPLHPFSKQECGR